jgi:hypothetical protein
MTVFQNCKFSVTKPSWLLFFIPLSVTAIAKNRCFFLSILQNPSFEKNLRSQIFFLQNQKFQTILRAEKPRSRVGRGIDPLASQHWLPKENSHVRMYLLDKKVGATIGGAQARRGKSAD